METEAEARHAGSWQGIWIFFFFSKCNRRALRDLCVKRSLWLLGRRVDCEWGQGEAEKKKGQEGGWQPVEEHLQLPE